MAQASAPLSIEHHSADYIDYIGNEIAIIGMACRVPGAETPDQLWHNVVHGVESVQRYSDDALREAGVPEDLIRNPNYVKAGLPLQGMDLFDPGFFQLRSVDAQVMDPQHRHFLECAWEALEDGGYDPERFPGRIGVFGGSGHNTYFPTHVLTNQSLLESEGYFLLRHTGNDKDFLTTRVSYTFNLTGPSINVQTACSTSLVAIHLAAQSLLLGESDMALAGGVTIELPDRQGYLYQPGEIYSSDGHCRAFDADADGTIFGSGVGIVLLKRLEDALASQDPIHAILLGTAINNDGLDKASYLAPSVQGQTLAISEALHMADIKADTIQLVEAHGTGTPLGDPIEIQALTDAFRQSTKGIATCAIGSIKTNIGHLDTAAGVIGLIKTVQALKHQTLPPSLNYRTPNPHIPFEESPFYVNTQPKNWVPLTDIPRRAAVSSLGVGGTNAHVILQEAPSKEYQNLSTLSSTTKPPQTTVPTVPSGEFGDSCYLLPLSALTATSLENNTTRLADYLEAFYSSNDPSKDEKAHAILSKSPNLFLGQKLDPSDLGAHSTHAHLADVAFTLQQGRRAFKLRRVVAGRNHQEILQAIECRSRHQIREHVQSEKEPKIVFMFPGGGSQYPGMGQDLYEQETVYREAVDQCLSILQTISAREISAQEVSPIDGSYLDFKALLYPAVEKREEAREQLTRPAYSLPALFITEYALAQLWLSWGIQPWALIGHSMGEYTAACLAGVFSVADALRIVTLRGKLFETLPQGAMLSVYLDEPTLQALLPALLSIGAINSATSCVVSGSRQEIDAFEALLNQREIEARRLPIQVAAHSPLLEPILAPFEEVLRTIPISTPTIPFISNVTGHWIKAEEATDPKYWVSHLRRTVRFSTGLQTLMGDDPTTFIEVGPGHTLTSLFRQQKGEKHHVALSSMRHEREPICDRQEALLALGELWTTGVEIDWSKLNPKGRRISLPTYAFDHQRYWLEPDKGTVVRGGSEPPAPQQQLAKELSTKEILTKGLVKQPKLSDWYYEPIWRHIPSETGFNQMGIGEKEDEQSTGPQTWLIFLDRVGIGQQLCNELEREGKTVVRVTMDNNYQKVTSQEYRLQPAQREHYISLIQSLDDENLQPERIIHLWTLYQHDSRQSLIEAYEGCEELGFLNLLYLAQAIGEMAWEHPLWIQMITNGLYAVGRKEVVYAPEKATLIGPALVIPQEVPNVSCQIVDIELPPLQAGLWRSVKQMGAQLWQQIMPASSQAGKGCIHNGSQLLPILSILHYPPEEHQIVLRDTGAWAAHISPARLGQSNLSAEGTSVSSMLRQRGVYIITGGLGGIGYTVATHLAGTYQARLVLMSRTPLPYPSDWDQWLDTHGFSHPISQKIAQVRTLEELGASVLVLSADVEDEQQVAQALQEAKERWGAIHGLFHAAGILDDQTIHLKEGASALRVLAPKIRGILNLSQALHEESLEFILLFSSTSTFLAPAGQVDYVAANAFLNAYAQHKAGPNDPPYLPSDEVVGKKRLIEKAHDEGCKIIALNWGMWQNMGMTAADRPGAFHKPITKKSTYKKSTVQAPLLKSHWESVAVRWPSHPLLDQLAAKSDTETTYITTYQANGNWLLDEHRLKGLHVESVQKHTAVMPGTGYIEMIAAVVEQSGMVSDGKADAFQIQDLFFLSPILLLEKETRQVRLTLKKSQVDEYTIQVSSLNESSLNGGEWVEHVCAQVLPLNESRPDAFHISTVLARCGHEQINYRPGQQETHQERYLAFGYRWKNLREIHFGAQEAVAKLELLPDFVADTKAYRLHPALFDLATSFALPLIPGYQQSEGVYVPVSYGSLKIYHPLPPKITSHARLKSSMGLDFPTFDVTIANQQGDVLADIQNFVLKRVNPDELQSGPPLPSRHTDSPPPLLERMTAQGILPHEGVAIIEQVLNQGCPSTIYASSLSLPELQQAVEADGSQRPRARENEQVDGTGTHVETQRPSHLTNHYIEPKNSTERQLVEQWQKSLGVRPIGIHDDFFELGGHSLIAVRLLAKMKKMFEVNISLDILFEAPTIEKLSQLINAKQQQNNIHPIDVKQTGIMHSDFNYAGSAQSDATDPISQVSSKYAQSAKDWSPLVLIHSGAPDMSPFFCIHGAGGNILNLHSLGKYLGHGRSFFGVQAQGVDGIHSPLRSISNMATFYLSAIREIQPCGPYLLGGYSGGGVVALEMAQLLREAKEEVALVVFLDTFHPSIEAQRTPLYQHVHQLLQQGPRYLRKRYSERRAKSEEEVQQENILSYVESNPDDIIPIEFREAYLVHHFIQALSIYQPQPYEGRVAQFTASNTWSMYQHAGASRGWEAVLPNLEIYTVPGDHDSMVIEPNVGILGARLTSLLASVDSQ
ncbi:MAG: SDR family NAD(P)-dependent oxidoreductase [Chloroflexota bacterium]